MKILVGFSLEEYPQVKCFEELGQCEFVRYDRKFLKKRINEFDMIVPHLFERLDDSTLSLATKLKIVSTPSTGTDHLDLKYLSQKGIPVTCLSDDPVFIDTVTSTAEMAWLLILACARKFQHLTARVSVERSWINSDIRGFELQSKTLGIIGFGRLGKKVANYGEAFGMNLLIHDSDPGRFTNTRYKQTALSRIFERSDFISLHVKLNETSKNMIDANALAKMKTGVIIVNTARGEVINSVDLLAAIQSGRVAAAGLDVLPNEFESGLLPSDPLLEAATVNPNIIITPHAGGSTHDAHDKVFKKVLNQIIQKLEIQK